MDINIIIEFITVIVTLIAGQLVKKYPNINKKRVIPIQNLTIGLIVALVELIITKDFSLAIAVSGLCAGGVYDLLQNMKLILKGDE